MLIADVDEAAGKRRCCRHHRRDEMGAPEPALAALEIAVRGRGTALLGAKLIRVHAEAHRAAWLAPVEACVLEDLVEAFGLSLLLHQPRARHDHGADDFMYMPTVDYARSLAQILDAAIGAGTDVHAVERQVGDLLAALQTHISERAHGGLALGVVGDLLGPRHAPGHRDHLLRARAPGDKRR